MSEQKCSEITDCLQELLDECSVTAGRETKFVQRQSKLTAGIFVKTLVLGLLEKGNSSLTELVQVTKQFGVDISESGLAQRMNAAGDQRLKGLIQTAISKLAQQVTCDERLFTSFSAVNIVDSSQISLPERCRGLAVGSGRVSDQKCPFPVDFAKAGSLTLFDLGYFNQAALAAIAKVQAFFVTRLNAQVALYWAADDPKPADLIAHLDAQQELRGEVSVFLGANTRLPVRVIYRRLPDKQVAEK